MRTLTFILLLLPVSLFAQIDETLRMNKLGIDLSSKLSEKEDFLLSPASLSMSFGMAYLGARENTKLQIKRVFYYPDDAEFESNYKTYREMLESEEAKPQILIANKLWIAHGFNIQPTFQSKCKDIFNNSAENIDFTKKIEAAKTMNKWISDQTNGKITNLIGNDLNPLTKLIITNTVYFNARFKTPFDPKKTIDGKFTNAKGELIDVKYMVADGYYNIHHDDMLDVTTLELPYSGDVFSLFIMLPTNMSAFEKKLENISKWDLLSMFMIAGAEPRTKLEKLQIPKFKYSNSLNLKDNLISLGLTEPFSEDRANFEGIGDRELFILRVVQNTTIEVSEEGTEASAATKIEMVERGIPDITEFVVDRPFYYVIFHRPSSSVIFMGKSSNPKF